MDRLSMSDSPPDLDAYALESCFCGKKTIESHEFWFCSTHCARLDALRSLNNPECHYRNNVRKAYVQASVPELYPRRMISVDQLRPESIVHHVVINSPTHLSPPTNATHKINSAFVHPDTQDMNMAGFLALSQIAGNINILNERAQGGEAPVAGRYDHARREIPSRAPSRVQHRDERIEEEPLRNAAPACTLRRVPPSTNNLRSNIRKSVATLFSRSHKDDVNSERVFSHAVDPIIPPMRKESLSSNHLPRNSPSACLVYKGPSSFSVACGQKSSGKTGHGGVSYQGDERGDGWELRSHVLVRQ